MERVTLVGGPADGRVIDVDLPANAVEVWHAGRNEVYLRRAPDSSKFDWSPPRKPRA